MTDIPEDIMAEAEQFVGDIPRIPKPNRPFVVSSLARALMGHEADLRQERDDARASYANLINIIADIREKSGVGGKPMLGELADAIEARIAAAEQRGAERERYVAEAEGELYDKCGVPIRRGDVLKVYHFTTPSPRKLHFMFKQCLGYKLIGKDADVPYMAISHLNFIESSTKSNGPYLEKPDGRVLADYEIVQSIKCDHKKRHRAAAIRRGEPR